MTFLPPTGYAMSTSSKQSVKIQISKQEKKDKKNVSASVVRLTYPGFGAKNNL